MSKCRSFPLSHVMLLNCSSFNQNFLCDLISLLSNIALLCVERQSL